MPWGNCSAVSRTSSTPAEHPELLKGEHSRNVGPAIDSWSEFQPLGVVAGITPFNFPAMVPLWMWPIAVVCGNTFVLKPSERNPSAVMYNRRAGTAGRAAPRGVECGPMVTREAVDALLGSERVKAVSFVGSNSHSRVYLCHRQRQR